MNTNQFTTEERFLMIRSINFRILNNYDHIPEWFENQKIFNKAIKPNHTILDKICQQDVKLTRIECVTLKGCLNDYKPHVSFEELDLLRKCLKKIKIK